MKLQKYFGKEFLSTAAGSLSHVQPGVTSYLEGDVTLFGLVDDQAGVEHEVK